MDYVNLKTIKTKSFGTLYGVRLKEKDVLQMGKTKATKLAKEIESFIQKRRAFYQKN